MPISQDRVDRTSPAAAELLAFAEGQVIEHAGSEVVVELDLRQAPVCSRRSWQGPVGHAGAGTQTIVESGVEIARVRVAQEDVKSVLGTLGLGLHLERIVPSRARVGRGGDCGKRAERRGGNSAAKCIAGYEPACGGGRHIQVTTVHQDAMTARTRISDRQHDTAGQFVFNIQVELLDSPLFEIAIL